jgi:hypothetical protein
VPLDLLAFLAASVLVMVVAGADNDRIAKGIASEGRLARR